MMHGTEFKPLFAQLIVGELGLECLHEVISRVRQEIWANNPVLKEIGWSQEEALRRLGHYEAMILKKEATRLANRLCEGEATAEGARALSPILLAAEKDRKINLEQFGLRRNDDTGEVALLEEIANRLAAENSKTSPVPPVSTIIRPAGAIVRVDFRRHTVVLDDAVHS